MAEVMMERTEETVNTTPEIDSVSKNFRLLSSEEQRIAFAVLEGMKLQKSIDKQQPLVTQ